MIFFISLVCADIDIMKTPNMASNLDATTNPGSISNVIPKAGAPDYWTPPTTDAVPAVQVILPVVNGAEPESYELTEINVIANNFDSFTVTIYDAGDNIAFHVSFLQQICWLICTNLRITKTLLRTEKSVDTTTLCLKKTSPMFLAITRESIVGFL